MDRLHGKVTSHGSLLFYQCGIVKWWMANKAKNAADLLFLCGMCAILTIAQKRK